MSDKLTKSETYMAREQAIIRTSISTVGFTVTYFTIKKLLIHFSKFFAAIPAKFQSEIVQILVTLLHDGYATIAGPMLVEKSFKEDRIGNSFDSIASTSLGFYLYDFCLTLSQGGKPYQLVEHGIINIPWTAYSLFSGYGRFYHNTLTVSRASTFVSNAFLVLDRTGQLSNRPSTRSLLKTIRILISLLIQLGFTPFMTFHFVKNSMGSINSRVLFVLIMFVLTNGFNLVALTSLLQK
jgi:hypothetical protein